MLEIETRIFASRGDSTPQRKPQSSVPPAAARPPEKTLRKPGVDEKADLGKLEATLEGYKQLDAELRESARALKAKKADLAQSTQIAAPLGRQDAAHSLSRHAPARREAGSHP